MGVAVDADVAAAIAGARPSAVNHVLNRQIRGRPRPLPLDIDAVSEGAGRTHSPARATVCKASATDTSTQGSTHRAQSLGVSAT